MAGRPKAKDKMTIIASTRLTNEQSEYIKQYAKERNISFGTAMRTIIDNDKANTLRR